MHVARLEMRTRFAEEIGRPLGTEAAEQTVRSNAVLKTEGDLLALRLEAEDTVALRAALNSYLRWLGMAEKITEEMKRN